jgi:hypothetical protein
MDNYDNLVDEALDRIQEAKAQKMTSKRTTITKITRQTKIDRTIGSLATQFAKKSDDSLYKKMVKYREKFYKFRDLIRKKYGPRVRSRAIQGKGISDMLKDKQKSGSSTGKVKKK